MENTHKSFIKEYVQALENGSAAIFVGAGFSMDSGYVNWRGLLKPFAESLGLDIEKENDLVAVAQYYVNSNGTRQPINDRIFNEFNEQVTLSENHKIIAQLPIINYWTTNYDSLIETALKEANKRPDVKKTNQSLSLTLSNRDAIVYKMHGDRESPNDAILIKDDYEKYYRDHAQFADALRVDLISKTFLFVGFSFTDPNIDYIFSRIKTIYTDQNKKRHFAIMRKVQESDYPDSNEEYRYAILKQKLFVEDLKRFNINTLMIDEYPEITNILKEVQKKMNRRNVFISGSAAEYANFSSEEAGSFIESLSKRLIQDKYRIISGFGLGIGSFVISGALKEIYLEERETNRDKLLLFPFPQTSVAGQDQLKDLWRRYREDMISQAGVAVFMFGNKKENDIIVDASGVKAEFDIARSRNVLIVPVGYTGSVALKIWHEVKNNMSAYYSPVDEKLIEALEKLGPDANPEQLVSHILKFIQLFQDDRYEVVSACLD